MAARAKVTLEPNALQKLKAVKNDVSPAGSVVANSEKRRGQTLRLSVESWKQLKIMAANEEKTSHDLLLEAVNMLFADRGRPTIA